jgi:hypothetical protein
MLRRPCSKRRRFGEQEICQFTKTPNSAGRATEELTPSSVICWSGMKVAPVLRVIGPS